ncbi:2-dehydropantoate 2-reductase protein [Halorhabdus tiamatea SARL4B]|uniref:2-dehydropantoate 2-reductase n=1 Tax=Halorhabdus tiamatea SARL4B TaxID=1033806 RepID=F7PM87_9EURY|nr:ketopantoate reductase family protein [Halorhabdus tiamatea]ERJ05508.1 2-dehydropantoate 2-reductase protein [Halorhabdus tiamatea SARL4B]CCQ32901.1 2-dehydropantoate 2-reductase [Halorhabdus tiamatea SARL4B]
MDVVVFGAGSLGSLLGGLLAREHAVTLVGREEHVRAVREDGLRITGEIDDVVRPQASTTVPDATDLAIVTVKAYDTPAAVEALSGCDCDGVLSLQNGMGNEERLAALDTDILAGTATYGAIQAEPGGVRCTGRGEVVLGPPDDGQSALADRIGDAFREAGIETTVAADMPRRLWEKLAVNAGINATTALARVPNGALADPPLAEVARRAARETARVARERGVDLSEDDAIAALESVVEATADNESSMYRDVQAGRRTEVDAINGYVADSDVDTPVNDMLAALLGGWERERNLRD